MIIGYTGTIGQSKTLNCVRYLYSQYLSGKTIYSNIRLNFPHIIITYEMMKDYANSQETLYDSIIFIDEIHLFLDSRRSGSKGNIIISYFLTQSRKKDVSVVWTSQFFNQVDLRLRNLTDIIGECRLYKFCKCKKDCRHIKVSEVNYHIRTTHGEKILVDRFIINDYYILYNTYEVVKNILQEVKK